MTISNLVTQVSERRAGFHCNCRKLVAAKFRNKVFNLHSRIFAQRKDVVKCNLCNPCIQRDEREWLNDGMDKAKFRKQWLREMRAKEGSVSALAEKIGAEANYLSSILGPNSSRGVGDSLARRIERAYRMPTGAMDFPSEGAQRLMKAAEGLGKDDIAKALEYIDFLKSAKN